MKGLMQDVPLSIPHIFDRAEKYFGHKEIVTVTGTGLERAMGGTNTPTWRSARPAGDIE